MLLSNVKCLDHVLLVSLNIELHLAAWCENSLEAQKPKRKDKKDQEGNVVKLPKLDGFFKIITHPQMPTLCQGVGQRKQSPDQVQEV